MCAWESLYEIAGVTKGRAKLPAGKKEEMIVRITSLINSRGLGAHSKARSGCRGIYVPERECVRV